MAETSEYASTMMLEIGEYLLETIDAMTASIESIMPSLPDSSNVLLTAAHRNFRRAVASIYVFAQQWKEESAERLNAAPSQLLYSARDAQSVHCDVICAMVSELESHAHLVEPSTTIAIPFDFSEVREVHCKCPTSRIIGKAVSHHIQSLSRANRMIMATVQVLRTTHVTSARLHVSENLARYLTSEEQQTAINVRPPVITFRNSRHSLSAKCTKSSTPYMSALEAVKHTLQQGHDSLRQCSTLLSKIEQMLRNGSEEQTDRTVAATIVTIGFKVSDVLCSEAGVLSILGIVLPGGSEIFWPRAPSKFIALRSNIIIAVDGELDNPAR